MFNSIYVRQAELMLRCLPQIGKQVCFALKGGTAINLFVRPMPRLGTGGWSLSERDNANH